MNGLMEQLIVSGEGYIKCRSSFYLCNDTLEKSQKFTFSRGTNLLCGEIDSGIWAISYLLSMSRYAKKEIAIFDKVDITANGRKSSLEEITQRCCYMDEVYPLFKTKKTVEKIIADLLKGRPDKQMPQQIRELFLLSSDRYDRPVNCTGNERFRMMAAIGYCAGKDVFCFPWLSDKRYRYFGNNLLATLEILTSLGKTVILPVGKA